MVAKPENASRGLLRSMMIIGSANGLKIIISLVRMKAIAILLGPVGIGLLSIYNNLQGVVSQAAGLGMRNSGVRELATSTNDDRQLSRVRYVLMAAYLIQGLVAMIAVWLLKDPISRVLFGSSVRALEVGVIGVGILFTLLASAQSALLQGMRRINELGRVTVLGALAGTLIGLFSVWMIGQPGLVWFVLIQPLASLLVAWFYTRRLAMPKGSSPNLSESWKTWKPMVRLGMAFMLGGVATAATLLYVRAHITQELGLDSVGYFSASWGIAMTYVGVMLNAIGTDYYPRLAEVVTDRSAANNLINDQSQLILALGGPVLLLLIGLAPWVIGLLYSSDFAPAARILQWQTAGNVLRLANWPLAFAILAAAHGRSYLLSQVNFNVVFATIFIVALPSFGLPSAGPAFAVGCVANLLLLSLIVRQINQFRWEPLTLKLLAGHSILAFALVSVAPSSDEIILVAAILLSGITAVLGVRVVISKIGPTGRIPERIARAYACIGWPIRGSEFSANGSETRGQ